MTQAEARLSNAANRLISAQNLTGAKGQGVVGFYKRLQALAVRYQEERPELEADDLTMLQEN